MSLVIGGMKLKSTGVVRRVDELGRVVIPIEIRRNYHISEKDAVEIFVKDDSIVLKKCESVCVFCSSSENIREFHGKNICYECALKISLL